LILSEVAEGKIARNFVRGAKESSRLSTKKSGGDGLVANDAFDFELTADSSDDGVGCPAKIGPIWVNGKEPDGVGDTAARSGVADANVGGSLLGDPGGGDLVAQRKGIEELGLDNSISPTERGGGAEL
jgi:hypothetical protein